MEWKLDTIREFLDNMITQLGDEERRNGDNFGKYSQGCLDSYTVMMNLMNTLFPTKGEN